MIRILLELGADPHIRTSDSLTPTMIAGKSIYETLYMKFLYYSSAESNTRIPYIGWTAAHDHKEIIEILVSECRCDVNVAAENGRTALIIATG